MEVSVWGKHRILKNKRQKSSYYLAKIKNKTKGSLLFFEHPNFQRKLLVSVLSVSVAKVELDLGSRGQ